MSSSSTLSRPGPPASFARPAPPPSGSISFTIRPPGSSSSSFAPARPSPLSRSSASAGPPSRNKFGNGRAGGDGSDDEEEEQEFGRGERSGANRGREEISGFGEDGDVQSLHARPSGPLVINPEPNRDWRQSSMARPTAASRARERERKPTYVPEGPARGSREAGPTIERSGDEPVRAGLTFVKREERDDMQVDAPDTTPGDEAEDVKPSPADLVNSNGKAREETLDEKALRALMQVDEDGKPKGEDLVIGMMAQDELSFPVDEADAFRRDILTRPAESTLDDYASTPIEAFGEALLRGMGWNPAAPSPSDTKIHMPKKRPAGLGLGATARPEAPAEGSSSGSSGQRKSEKQKREDYKQRSGRGYMPVMKRERDSAAGMSGNENGRPGGSTPASRRSPRSPSPPRMDRRDSERDRRRDRDGEGGHSRHRSGDRSSSQRPREGHRDEHDRSADRRERDRDDRADRDRRTDRDRHERDHERSRGSDRGGGSDRDRERRDRDRYR